jgi:hypothetical protein
MLGFQQSEENQDEEEPLYRRTDRIDIAGSRIECGDGDREAYEFSHALYLARQVDRKAAQMVVEAAEAGLIQINKAIELLMQLSRQSSKCHLFG